MTASLPTEIAIADPRVVRPVDLRGRYANPPKEFRKFAARGALLRVAHGYYVVVPEPYRGTSWRPQVEAVGLAIAQADYGRDRAAAMGVSAARILDAIPRSLGTAVIAIAAQRPALRTAVGVIRFVRRDVGRLDVERAETELGQGWVTTVEQTIIDLAHRPGLGDLTRLDVDAAIERLWRRADPAVVDGLAAVQRKRPAAARARVVAARGEA